MSATTAQIAEVRRMVAEPTTDTYSDALITTFIERYPLMDERGEVPYTFDTSTEPPTQDANDEWIDTYDLHAAAADIWQEKAAALGCNFDFTADGGQFLRGQLPRFALAQARYHRSRRAPQTHTLWMYPEPGGADHSWIANLAEAED